MTEWKVCTKCGHNKPLERFRKDNRKSDGRGYVCKECDSEMSRVRMANIRHQEKEMHSTNPPVRTGANKVRTFARPQINMGADTTPPPQTNLQFTDSDRKILRQQEVEDFLEEMGRTWFEHHWILNMNYYEIIDVATKYVCACTECSRRGFQFVCWRKSMLEIAPVCYRHLDALTYDEGICWAEGSGLIQGSMYNALPE